MYKNKEEKTMCSRTTPMNLNQGTNEKSRKTQSLQRKALYKKNAHYNKSNPNYYPSVVSVDSSSIESPCIFPETLNKTHKRMCGK